VVEDCVGVEVLDGQGEMCLLFTVHIVDSSSTYRDESLMCSLSLYPLQTVEEDSTRSKHMTPYNEYNTVVLLESFFACKC